MFKCLKTFLRQAIFSYVAIAAAIIFPCLIFITELDAIKNAVEDGTIISVVFLLNLMIDAIKGKTVCFALPILCALPYTASLVEDRNSGFLKFILQRTDKRKYIISKEFACAVSGGIVILAGLIISLFLIFLSVFLFYGIQSDINLIWNLIIRVGRFMLLFSFTAMFLSSLGMMNATLTSNRLTAYISPFIFYYILIIFHERNYISADILYPVNWISADSMTDMGIFVAAASLALATGLIMAIHFLLAKRRISNA